jgi:hypothetical protein
MWAGHDRPFNEDPSYGHRDRCVGQRPISRGQQRVGLPIFLGTFLDTECPKSPPLGVPFRLPQSLKSCRLSAVVGRNSLKPRARVRRLLDSLDGNLAWTNRHLVKADGRLEDIRVELRSISDQLARQKR